MKASVEDIDRCLPQTQCTQCNYPGCREYAEAIAAGEAEINQCPPGGEVTINALANLLNVSPRPLNRRFGEHLPKRVANIIEAECIGCMLCIKACPVDAIIGSNKQMHSVIESECTGCELCLPPCPMDCITLVEPSKGNRNGPWEYYSQAAADNARQRRADRLHRLDALKQRKKTPRVDRKSLILQSVARRRAQRNEP